MKNESELPKCLKCVWNGLNLFQTLLMWWRFQLIINKKLRKKEIEDNIELTFFEKLELELELKKLSKRSA